MALTGQTGAPGAQTANLQPGAPFGTQPPAQRTVLLTGAFRKTATRTTAFNVFVVTRFERTVALAGSIKRTNTRTVPFATRVQRNANSRTLALTTPFSSPGHQPVPLTSRIQRHSARTTPLLSPFRATRFRIVPLAATAIVFRRDRTVPVTARIGLRRLRTVPLTARFRVRRQRTVALFGLFAAARRVALTTHTAYFDRPRAVVLRAYTTRNIVFHRPTTSLAASGVPTSTLVAL